MPHLPLPSSLFPPRSSLLAILFLAALLRLGWPALTEFKADEARLYALALDMAEFKSFALRGIGSSVGFPNFPMSVWLYAIPLLVWKHPYSATLFVAALNTLAVYVCYRLTRIYYGETAALVATLFFAVSPWAVIYSRKIWAQDLLPLFVLGYIGTALAAFVAGRRWFLIVHFLFLAVVIQIHLSGLALIPLTILWLIAFRRRVRWREAALGMIAAVLTALPFAIYLLSQTAPISNLQSLVFNNLLSRPGVIDFDSARFAWLTLTGADIHSLAGPAAFRQFLDSVPNIDLARWLWGGLAIAGCILALVRRRDVDLILASWFLLPILLFVRHSAPLFPHYFIVLFPAGYILGGSAVGALERFFAARMQKENEKVSSRLRGSIIGGIVIASALAQAGVWLALLFFIGRVATPNGFGTPLGTMMKMVEEAKAVLRGREILIVGPGDDPNVDEFPAVADVLFRDAPHRFVNGDEAAVFPARGAVAVIAPQPLAAGLWYRHWGEPQDRIQLREGEGAFEIVNVPGGVAIEVVHPFSEPRRLANGVELLGWDSESRWMVIWRVGYVPPAADYHFFNQTEGAQADGPGFPSRYWREDDFVISFFDLRPTDKPVRVGMYEYPSVTNVPVMDEAGNPFSDAVVAQP
jgi:4-amino-4-deoxy-L-arabinose transferase-like glycosyltransferase